MNKLISHALSSGGVKTFDTLTGEVSPAEGVEWGKTEFGAVWEHNKLWFAFYCDEESLILQHKTSQWRVNEETQTSLTGHVLREFKVVQIKKVLFSVFYKPKGRLAAHIDPTYDTIDEETDDFFLYVHNMWRTWAGRPFSEFLEKQK